MAQSDNWWARDVAAAGGPTAEELRQSAAETRAQAAERRAEEASRRAAASEARSEQEFKLKFGTAPTPGDATKTGDEYLATLPPSMAAQVKAVAEGRRAMPTGYALRNPQVQELIAAANQYDPTLDAANAATRVATRKDFTSGKAAQNMTSLNTAIGHLATLQKAARNLGNWDIRGINTIGNAIRTGMGDPRVRNFQIARQAVASELTRAFRGTGGSMTEVKDWESAINESDSPEQLEGAIRQATELLQSRLDSMQTQYQQGMGKSADVMQFLTPKNRKMLEDLQTGGTAEGKTADVFAGPPEGTRTAGEDVKGWRYAPETEQKLLDYIHSPEATPEGYAKLAADAAVAEKHIPAEQRDAYLQSSLNTYKPFFEGTTPEQRAGVRGIDYSAVDRAATENAGLGASVAQALRNVPESGANLVEGLAALPASAIASVAEGEPVGATGGLLNLAGEMGSGPATEALKASLAERYGNLKRTGIIDPLGLAGDVSLALTAGGGLAARAPGVLGEAGNLTRTIGKVVDPLSGMVALPGAVSDAAARLKAPGLTSFLKNLPSEIAGMPSGAGGAALREATAAGFERGRTGAPTARSEAFTGSMRDPLAHVDDVVSTARDAVANLREQASRRYQQAMQQFGKNPEPLPMDTVITRVARLKPRNYDAMLNAPRRPSDHLAWEQMMDTVTHYAEQAAQDPSLLEPLAMDAFKQDLYDVGSKIGGAYDRQAARIAGTAYNAVRQELVKHDPLYATTMKDYEAAAKQAQQLEGSFGLAAARGKQPNIDAATRKLQSIMRNNAYTNYGQRAAQGEQLAALDPTGTLLPSIGGQMVSAVQPRGLHSLPAIGSALTAAALNPATLPLVASFSPRAMGEAAYGVGRAAGAVRRAADVAAPTIDKLSELYNRYPTATLAVAQTGNRLEDARDELQRKYNLEVTPPAGWADTGGY